MMRMVGRYLPERRRSAVAIRHVAFEDLGRLAGPLDERGWNVAYCEASTDQLSHYSIRDADLVIVLGGPISVTDMSAYRFLSREMHLIERRLGRGQPVLGIGLGAELMAGALGARVFAGPTREIGWGPVTLTSDGLHSPLAPLARPDTKVLHWHGDTFDLPPGARRLASSGIYENQAFGHGTAGLGLQFHVEADARSLEEWYVGHAVALAGAGIDLRQLRRDSRSEAPRTAPLAAEMFENWLESLFPDETTDLSSGQPDSMAAMRMPLIASGHS